MFYEFIYIKINFIIESSPLHSRTDINEIN
jgi:hypothetical protein